MENRKPTESEVETSQLPSNQNNNATQTEGSQEEYTKERLSISPGLPGQDREI